MDKQEIAARLNEAADLIERRGWWDGKRDHPHTGYCILTAFGTVESQALAPKSPIVAAFNSFMGFRQRRQIRVWNDKAKRTKAEVIAALRGAAQAQLEGKS